VNILDGVTDTNQQKQILCIEHAEDFTRKYHTDSLGLFFP